MAVPETYTMLDLSGKFTMNKGLSDGDAFEKMLEHQGVGVLKRKAIGFANPTMCIKHHTAADGVEHIDIEQHIKSGSAPKTETRVLTWAETTNESPLFGSIVTKTRRVNASELDDEFLKEGWTADTVEAGVIQVHARSEGGVKWVAMQTWGIEEVKGERRHTRHWTFTGPKGQTVHCRLVYDYGRLLLYPAGPWLNVWYSWSYLSDRPPSKCFVGLAAETRSNDTELA
ncbi:hypothetical protein C8R44DRAFT_636367 [Mycena epipterygia]|nr:hypothetical protein C8R44DRAFT_636367 [Mycena epipterygia]